MYKAGIYIITVLLSVYALSGINFNNFFKKEHDLEAKVFVIILAFVLGYLLGSFIIDFLSYSKVY
ncbi:MAG: DUF1146 domain-containing protein [Bacilli bacterium]|nr:DUF1146 domain-containing protein [Bacilli bacterium]